MKEIAAIFGVGVLVVGLLIGGMWMNYSNKEVALRAAITAQTDVNKASFDAMWKILQQQAGVASEYKDAFKDIYPDMIKGRYAGSEGKNLLAKFITESNPKFDTKLYVKLSNSIEAERKRFLNDQKKLIDYQREHTKLLQSFPSSLFLSGRLPIEIAVITSDKTDDTFQSKKDNDTKLFGK